MCAFTYITIHVLQQGVFLRVGAALSRAVWLTDTLVERAVSRFSLNIHILECMYSRYMLIV